MSESQPIREDIKAGGRIDACGAGVVLCGEMVAADNSRIFVEGNLTLRDFEFVGGHGSQHRGIISVKCDKKGVGGDLTLAGSVKFSSSPHLRLEAERSILLKITDEALRNLGMITAIAPEIHATALKYYCHSTNDPRLAFFPSEDCLIGRAVIENNSHIRLSGTVPGNICVSGFATAYFDKIESLSRQSKPSIICGEIVAGRIDGATLQAMKLRAESVSGWLSVTAPPKTAEGSDFEVNIGEIVTGTQIKAPGAKLFLREMPESCGDHKIMIDLGETGELHILETNGEKLALLRQENYLTGLNIKAGAVYVYEAKATQTLERIRNLHGKSRDEGRS